MSNKRKNSPPADRLDDWITIAGASREMDVLHSTLTAWTKSASLAGRIRSRDWYGTTVYNLADLRTIAAETRKPGRKPKADS